MYKIIITINIMLIHGYAFGQFMHPIDKELKHCMDSATNTREMQACYMTAYENWDKELNRYYSAYLKELSDENRESLRQSQRNWIKFRDSEFDVIDRHYLTELEGTMWRPISINQRANLVKERALKLKELYEELLDMR